MEIKCVKLIELAFNHDINKIKDIIDDISDQFFINMCFAILTNKPNIYIYNYTEFMEYLIKVKNVDINFNISNSTTNTKTPLYNCINTQNKEIMILLLKNNAKINPKILKAAVFFNNIDFFKEAQNTRPLSNLEKSTALFEAIGFKKYDIIEYLLELGADPYCIVNNYGFNTSCYNFANSCGFSIDMVSVIDNILLKIWQNNIDKIKFELLEIAWSYDRVLDWCIDINKKNIINKTFNIQ